MAKHGSKIENGFRVIGLKLAQIFNVVVSLIDRAGEDGSLIMMRVVDMCNVRSLGNDELLFLLISFLVLVES